MPAKSRRHRRRADLVDSLRPAVTLLVAGMVLTPFAEGIGLVIGVLSLVGFIALGAIELLRPDKLADD